MGAPVSGLLDQVWGLQEATYDTVQAVSASDAIDVKEPMTIEPNFNHIDKGSHTGTGSYQGAIADREGGTWSIAHEIQLPSAGTEPDIGFALEAALGQKTVASSSVTYSLPTSQSEEETVTSLQFERYTSDAFYEVITGCWVEELQIAVANSQICAVTLSGGFATYGYLYGSPTVNGSHSASATIINITSGDIYKIRPNVLIQFTGEDNGGSGYRVTDIDYANDTITIGTGLAGGLSGGESITPLIPGRTTAGSRIGATQNDLSIDSTSIGLISANYTFSTGITGLNNESSTSKPSRLFRAERRSIELEHTSYFLDESVPYLGGAWNSATRNIVTRAGPDTSGSRMKIQTPAVRLQVTPVPMPDAEAATVTLSGRAEQSSSAGDELSLLLD